MQPTRPPRQPSHRPSFQYSRTSRGDCNLGESGPSWQYRVSFSTLGRVEVIATRADAGYATRGSTFSTLGRVEVIATPENARLIRLAYDFQYSRTSRGDCNLFQFKVARLHLPAFSTLGRVEVIATGHTPGIHQYPWTFQYSRTSRGDCNLSQWCPSSPTTSLSVLSDESR